MMIDVVDGTDTPVGQVERAQVFEEHAVQRRVRQELGIFDFSLTALGKTTMDDEGCLKFVTLFGCLHEGPFAYDKSHIDEVEFVVPTELAEMMKRQDRAFTPTFVRVFDFYRSLNPAK